MTFSFSMDDGWIDEDQQRMVSGFGWDEPTIQQCNSMDFNGFNGFHLGSSQKTGFIWNFSIVNCVFGFNCQVWFGKDVDFFLYVCNLV